jgi:hypothetical protein
MSVAQNAQKTLPLITLMFADENQVEKSLQQPSSAARHLTASSMVYWQQLQFLRSRKQKSKEQSWQV